MNNDCQVNQISEDKIFAVAPMMMWTTKHCRMFHRQLSQRTVLYTEMVTSGALIHGDSKRYLSYNSAEQPVVLQVGGGESSELAKAVEIANPYQYSQINLNVGCPSDRVQRGKIGAILMKEPQLVGECFKAMQAVSDSEITIKNRLSVDDMPEQTVFNFVETVANAGCKTFIIHARKAFLQGLDPKANRSVPPLNYELVYQVKEKFPELNIQINGGIKTLAETTNHFNHVDGVMMGREAYLNPWILAGIDALYDANAQIITRKQALENLADYVSEELDKGEQLKHIVQPWFNLYHGVRGAKAFKRFLSENLPRNNSIEFYQEILAKLPD